MAPWTPGSIEKSKKKFQDLQSVLPAITADALDVLSVDHSVASRTSEGGTAPENVLKAIAAARNEG